jgi:MinD-like ATPase involved in chromosome partitioning or flagellar assembly
LKLQLDAACREVLERPRSAFSQAIANLLEREIGLESRETVKALFISKADGLGATTIAVNVAQMAANAGARVLLIEANRQRPVLASLISPQVSVDLIDLAGTRRIICRLRPGFSVIPLFEEETSGLLEERARQCIKGIGRHFDLVIVDGGTFADDDIETMELVDSVNRVFHLTPEGIELKTGRRAFQRRR